MARVLIVDDQPDLRGALVAVVETDGHDVVEAEDGRDALEKALECSPDVVLMDCHMAGVNGFEALRQLKLASTTRHVPVIMVTVLNDEAARRRAAELGADGFVTKPWGNGELEWSIRRAITSSAAGGNRRHTGARPR